MAANIVMLEAWRVLTDVVLEQAMSRAMLDGVPEGSEGLNEAGFERRTGFAVERRWGGKTAGWQRPGSLDGFPRRAT